MSVGEAALTFCFEVLTDVAFVPPLMIMHRYRRHFELYVGVFQLTTGFLYNFCNALGLRVFLTELQWHGLNNILTTTYFLLLLIHLQANSNPTVDIVLRYAAFTAVWIAQIKDEYVRHRPRHHPEAHTHALAQGSVPLCAASSPSLAARSRRTWGRSSRSRPRLFRARCRRRGRWCRIWCWRTGAGRRV